MTEKDKCICIFKNNCAILMAEKEKSSAAETIITYIGRLAHSGLSDEEIVKKLKLYFEV
jgi:hypothetical protein